MTTSEIKAFITTYTDEVWTKRNVSAMDKFYDARYIHHDASSPDLRTLSDYKQWAEMLLSGFSDFKVEIVDIMAEPGKAFKRWTVSGLHDSTFAGISPTGKRVKFSGMSVYWITDRRITECWYVYDMLGLLQQLGAIPVANEAV